MDLLSLKRKEMNGLIPSKNKKMKNEEKINCLCEEIMEEILSHLPIEFLIKCKFVSKQWNLLISNMFWYRNVPKFGLLHQYTGNNFLPKLDFLSSMKDDEEEALDEGQRRKSKSKQIWRRNCCLSKGSRLLGSSNGLLIFINTRNTNVYYVCNPILHEWVMLPPPPYHGDSSTMDPTVPSLGIAYDGIQGHHYKVVLVKMMKSDIQTGFIDSKIFTSETGEWRTHQARMYNSCLLLNYQSWSGTLNQPSFYGKRNLYWIMKSKRYMLFYIEMECFELVALPSYDIDNWTQTQSGWVWESEGKIHCCYGGIDRIYLWTCNDDYEDGEDENIENWVLKHVIMHETLVNQVPIQYLNSIRCKPESFKMIRYCTFDKRLNVMYICMKGIVYSYSFESERLEVAWQIYDNVWSVQGFYSTNSFYPYLFNLADLPKWDGLLNV